eukprot:2639697-Rhodomonas_salina.1
MNTRCGIPARAVSRASEPCERAAHATEGKVGFRTASRGPGSGLLRGTTCSPGRCGQQRVRSRQPSG